MSEGRAQHALDAPELDSWKIIRLGQIVLGAALAVLLLPGAPEVAAAALFLVGLGFGIRMGISCFSFVRGSRAARA